MRVVIFALFLLACAPGRGDPLEVCAHMGIGNEQFFVVRDPSSREKSGWLKLGDTWHGHVLISYHPVSGKLIATPDPGGYHERLIRVSACPPPGFASKPFEKLVLVAGGTTYRMDWSPGSIHHAPVLVPGRQYEFVLVERSNPRVYGPLVWHSVSRVMLGPRVLFDDRVCEVHGGPLESKFIPTLHGLSRLDFEEQKTRTDYFPHAESGRAVPCEALTDEPALTEIWICRECESAYRLWTRARTTQ